MTPISSGVELCSWKAMRSSASRTSARPPTTFIAAATRSTTSGGSFAGFFVMFLVLFLTTGIGNGSTFRMIPVIFMTERQRAAAGKGPEAAEKAIKDGNREAAAVLGFSAAMAAYGGFFIPKSYGTSIAMTGGPEGALYIFIAFYAICIAVTWWYYARRNAQMPC